MEKPERWQKLCVEQGWLQSGTFVAPEGHHLVFCFNGVDKNQEGGSNGPPGFIVASDPSQYSLKNAPCSTQVTGEFIVAKPLKGYNVSVWTYYLWEDLVSIELSKLEADRVV